MMTQWYVKELSKLTRVSVRTLHHYDKIGLLKPSIRQKNGYRLYSEADLLKLQQILALKFFGFELSRIKVLIQEKINLFDHFQTQKKFLEEKIRALQEACKTLDVIVSDCSHMTSVPWKTLIKLIEDYHMTQQLEHPWIAKFLNPDELKEYAQFEQGLKTRYTGMQKKTFEQEWFDLVVLIEENLDQDPTSNLGIHCGKKCMDLVNGLYGKEHAALRTTIWEKGYKKAQMEGEHGLSPQVIAWLDKAVDAYYRGRIYTILSEVNTQPSDMVLKMWRELLEDMYGTNQPPKDALYEMAIKDEKVSQAAKEWLRSIRIKG